MLIFFSIIMVIVLAWLIFTEIKQGREIKGLHRTMKKTEERVAMIERKMQKGNSETLEK